MIFGDKINIILTNMGIKHFFIWYKRTFPKNIKTLAKRENFKDINVKIDNLMLDLNGIFHTAAQKVYEYGNHKKPARLLATQKKKEIDPRIKERMVFKEVTKEIDKLVAISKPKKRILLCIDGPAPISKQNQQRQRRFRSAKESEKSDCPFDSNSITPGTRFMDSLSRYIDKHIKYRISRDRNWKQLQVVFSDEKVPGEGEHKIINFIRHYGELYESYCISGLDADLIMLSLATHMPSFYILREDLYDPKNEYMCLNIGRTRYELVELLKWESEEHEFRPEFAINDFVFICFMTGNDFLPHVPSIEIIEDGIELMITTYKDVCSRKGHLTLKINDGIKFQKAPMKEFFTILGDHEKENFDNKINSKKSFFPDELLNSNVTTTDSGGLSLNIKSYISEYCTKKLGGNVKKVCHEYLEGMQWVLSYYTRGVPNWKWLYKHHYAPPASVIKDHIMSFKFPSYNKTIPSTPYQQLLSVLPPKSAKLIPKPLCNLLLDSKSPLKKYCPDDFKIDLSGKRREWEGTVILPFVDLALMRRCYFKNLDKIDKRDLARNRRGNSFVYTFMKPVYYGEDPIRCVQKEKIILS